MKNKYIFFKKLKKLKLLTSIVLFFFVATTAKSQHCGFDFASIIVLKVHSIYDTINIPNLRITLIDKKNKTLLDYANGSNLMIDTVTFYQNLNQPTFKYLDEYNDRYNFPFAKNDYISVCATEFPIDEYYIKIEDVDGTKNGGKFVSEKVRLFEIDKYQLCGNYDKMNYTQLVCRRVYKPIEVILVNEK